MLIKAGLDPGGGGLELNNLAIIGLRRHAYLNAFYP